MPANKEEEENQQPQDCPTTARPDFAHIKQQNVTLG
jgi:hypothetical protein